MISWMSWQQDTQWGQGLAEASTHHTLLYPPCEAGSYIELVLRVAKK